MKRRSRLLKSKGGGIEFTNSGTGFDMNPVSHEGHEEQAVLEFAEEKKFDP